LSGTAGYLLDTSAALIALAYPDRLSARVRKAILAGPNVLSAIVYWEVVLKSMKGALDVGDPRTWWIDALEQLAAIPLALRPEHITEVYALPPIHKDPFDRILIAQAGVEGLTLLTTDGEIPKYAGKGLRVIS
jgi:PIN domain nuclease of toxin-antitoxin system